MPKFIWKKHGLKKYFRRISAPILLSLGISSGAFAADITPQNDNIAPAPQETTTPAVEKNVSELSSTTELVQDETPLNMNSINTTDAAPITSAQKESVLTDAPLQGASPLQVPQAQEEIISNNGNGNGNNKNNDDKDNDKDNDGNLRHEFQSMLNDMQVFIKKMDDEKTHYPVFYSPLDQNTAPQKKLNVTTENTPSAFSPTTELPQNLQKTISSDLEHIQGTLTKPQILSLQKDFITLGFDLGRSGADGVKGRKTNHAAQEFFLFYGSLAGLTENKLNTKMITSIHSFAEQAREDSKTYNIASNTVAAIRLAHLKIGSDFGFLMELAKTESSFNIDAANTRSTARGLYQFTEATWLDSLSRYGSKYGLGFYADHIEFKTDDKGKIKPVINSPFLHTQALDLRFNPRISALMAGELTQHNKTMLRYIGNTQNPSRTDLYIAHFFGTSDAMTFMRALKYTPTTAASNLFPDLARANPSIFNGNNYKQIYTYFNSKFNTDKYELPKPKSNDNDNGNKNGTTALKTPHNPRS